MTMTLDLSRCTQTPGCEYLAGHDVPCRVTPPKRRAVCPECEIPQPHFEGCSHVSADVPHGEFHTGPCRACQPCLVAFRRTVQDFHAAIQQRAEAVGEAERLDTNWTAALDREAITRNQRDKLHQLLTSTEAYAAERDRLLVECAAQRDALKAEVERLRDALAQEKLNHEDTGLLADGLMKRMRRIAAEMKEMGEAPYSTVRRLITLADELAEGC